MRPLVLLVAAALSVCAHAATAPAADYAFGADIDPGIKKPADLVGAAEYGIFMCSMAFNLSRTMAELKEAGRQLSADDIAKSDYRRCIALHKERVKTAHQRASRLAKGPDAKNALKEYATLATIALDGLVPAAAERVVDYERRTNAEKRDLDKQKVRLDAELD